MFAALDLSLSQSSADVDRHAAGLAKAASSLLLLQPVLQGPIAQAFLVLLGAIAQRKRPTVVEAYGVFYRELVLSGCASWQEHLLGEVSALNTPRLTQAVTCCCWSF